MPNMPDRRQRTRAIAAVLCASALVASGLLGVRLGQHYERNWQCCRVPNPRRIVLSLEETLGMVPFRSGQGQDKWVAERVFPGVTDGFFLDVGSADGVDWSNTYALERKGWTGICVDPFPRNMQARTCRVFRSVVDSQPGRHVKFYNFGDLGGIRDYLNHTKEEVEKYAPPPVDLVTTTVAKILEEAKAPSFIHFMSLDVEGAELAALQGFPFDTVTLGALVVEHNFEVEKRAAIEALLTSRGYVRVHSWYGDDYYLPASRVAPVAIQ